MTEGPGRGVRAVRNHDAFERVDENRFESTTTAFEADVTVSEDEDGVVFEVRMRVPTLSAVVTDDVAPVVEEGWLETFDRRVADVDSVTRGDAALDPAVRRDGDTVLFDVTVTDVDARRGVDDVAAIVDYVEGTYVQGIIPGYDYTAPVTELIDRARTGGGGP